MLCIERSAALSLPVRRVNRFNLSLNSASVTTVQPLGICGTLLPVGALPLTLPTAYLLAAVGQAHIRVRAMKRH